MDNRIYSWNDNWTEKSNKLEKNNEMLLYQINAISKYIRDQKEEMNTIKLIVAENQEK